MKRLLNKFVRTGAALLLTATLFTACKKEEPVIPIYPIEGLWVGKYGSAAATPNSGFSMVVESGGKITVADGNNITSSSKAPGTWMLTGNVFKATYTYPGGSTFTIQATWSNDGKMTTGTYGLGSSATGGGTWYMDRKN